MNNNSFYAGPKGQDIIISKIFNNRVEMENDLLLKDVSEVEVGSLVLISYGEYGTSNFRKNVDLDASKYQQKNFNAYVYEKKRGINPEKDDDEVEEFYYSFVASLIPSQIPVGFIMNNNMTLGGKYNVELVNTENGKQNFKLTLPPPLFELTQIKDDNNTANLQVTVNGQSQNLGNIRGIKGDKGDPSGFNIIGKIDDITVGEDESIIDPSKNSSLKEELDSYFNNINNFNGSEVVVANAIFEDRYETTVGNHYETIYYYRIKTLDSENKQNIGFKNFWSKATNQENLIIDEGQNRLGIKNYIGDPITYSIDCQGILKFNLFTNNYGAILEIDGEKMYEKEFGGQEIVNKFNSTNNEFSISKNLTLSLVGDNAYCQFENFEFLEGFSYVYSRVSAQVQDYSYHDSDGIIFGDQTFISNLEKDKGIIYSNWKVLSGQFIPLGSVTGAETRKVFAISKLGDIFKAPDDCNEILVFWKDVDTYWESETEDENYRVYLIDCSKMNIQQEDNGRNEKVFYLGYFGLLQPDPSFFNVSQTEPKYCYTFDFEINFENWSNENKQLITLTNYYGTNYSYEEQTVTNIGEQSWEKIRYYWGERILKDETEEVWGLPLYLKIANYSEDFFDKNKIIKIKIPKTTLIYRAVEIPMSLGYSQLFTRGNDVNIYSKSYYNREALILHSPGRSGLLKFTNEEEKYNNFLIESHDISNRTSFYYFSPKQSECTLQVIPQSIKHLEKNKIAKEQKPGLNFPGLISLSDIQKLNELYDYYKISKKQIIYNSGIMNFTWDTTNKVLGTDQNYNNFYNFLSNNTTNNLVISNFNGSGFNFDYKAKNQEQTFSRHDLYFNNTYPYNNGFMEFKVPNISNLKNYNKIYIEVLFTRRSKNSNAYPYPAFYLEDKDNRIIGSMPQQVNTLNFSKFFIVLEKIFENTNNYVIFSQMNNYSGIMPSSCYDKLTNNFLYANYGHLPIINLDNSDSFNIYLRASINRNCAINGCEPIPKAFENMQIIVRGEN